MGNKETVSSYDLSAMISIFWCPDGDHSFKPRKASGETEIGNWDLAVSAVREFVKELV